MDLRKFERTQLNEYLNVLDDTNHASFGFLSNLSNSGFMLLSETEVELGREFTLSFIIPGASFSEGCIKLTARSVWCRDDLNPDLYATGFVITRIDLKNSRLIDSYLGRFH
jgi:hypothetical protein